MDLSGRGDPSPMPHAEDDDIQDLIESLISSYKFGIPESSERNGPSPPPEPVTERQAEDVHSNIEPINTPPSIAELRQQCVLAFETCVHYESLMNHQWAENRFADFNLSVEGVGALSESGASPDSCFESGQDDMALVQNALTMLKNFLAECISCAKERSSTDAATEKVDSSLEKLALIVAAIRKTGMRSRLARDGRFKLKEHEELAAFLRVICLRRNTSNKFGIEVGKEDRKDVFKFERLSTQEIIKISEEVQLSKAQQRLIEVNLRRRNRFLQAQEHSKNLKACQNGKQEIVGNTRVELDRGTQRLPNMKPLSPENPERNSTRGLAQRQIQPTPTAAETKAPTAEGSFQVRRAKRTASQPAMTVMSAITAITALTAAAQYPKAPDVCQKSTMFKCPCCCQTLPAKFGTDKDLWKKHLAEDISPYTCILQDCPTPFATFTTVSDWERHFKTEHRPCRVCPLCANADGVFSGMEDLTTHIETEHAEVASTNSVQIAISWSGVTTIGISHCPLCDFTGTEHAPEFVRHVLGCIHEFSLYSLPWADYGQVEVTRHVWACKPETIGDGEGPLRRWFENRDVEAMEASRIKLDLTGSDGVQMQATHSSNDYFAESGNEFFGIASAQNSLEALKRYLGSSDYLDESESKLAESYLRMSDFSVPLTDIEEFGGTYRARNLNGEDFNQVLQDYGNNGQSFIFRAEILLVCNGRLKDGGDGTVVIFRFTFSTAENVSQRRFTSAKITVEFSDFLGRPANDPEVVTLFPERLHNLDIVTNSSVKGQQANAATGTSEPARLRFGAGLKLSQTDSDVYYARLMPVTWNTRPKKSGQDNAALWRLKEHTSKENGVPDFLQTAVILRRNGDGKFRMKIKIEATVDNRIDMKPTIEKMFGEIELGPVDPVNINPASFLGKEIDIPWLVGGILDALDLDMYVGVGLTDERNAERQRIREVDEEEQQRKREAEEKEGREVEEKERREAEEKKRREAEEKEEQKRRMAEWIERREMRKRAFREQRKRDAEQKQAQKAEKIKKREAEYRKIGEKYDAEHRKRGDSRQ